MTFEILAQPENISIEIINGIATLTPDDNFNGMASIQFNASDGSLSKESNVVGLTIIAVNDAPIIMSFPVTSATQGQLYTYDLNAVDPDNDELTYSLTIAPSNMTIDQDTGLISWTPTNSQVGMNNVTANVFDALNTSNVQSFTINVSNINDAPMLTSQIPNQTWNEDNSIAINLSSYFSDPDNDALTFEILAQPENISIEIINGIATLTPDDNFNGMASIQFNASDGSLSTDSNIVGLNIMPVNDAPIIITTPLNLATEDQAYSVDIDAFDVEGDTINYSLVTYPAGMAIDSSTGLISWTPTNSQVGNNSVVVQAEDINNATGLLSFAISVLNVNDAPILIQNIPNQTWNEDNSIAINLSSYFSDPDNDILSYNIAVLPLNINANIQNGIVTLIPDNNFNGMVIIQFSASDGLSSTDSNIVQLTITAVNDAPAITSTPFGNATQDALYQTDVDATDVDGDSITYSLTTKPDGMTINTEMGLISWTPANSQVGINNVVVEAKDENNATATQQFTIDVANVNDAPILIQNIPNQTWNEDNSIAINLSSYFSDPDNDTLTYSTIIQPENISVEIINGIATLTPDDDFNGITSIQFNASDGSLSKESNVVGLTIIAVNDAPILGQISNIGANEGDLVAITAVASDAENDQLTYAIDDARFVQNNNVFTWQTTLNDSGSYNVNVSVSDSQGAMDSQTVFVVLASMDNDDDGLLNGNDNCPNAYNPGQEDSDNDGVGDACDACTDTDNDQACDGSDNCIGLYNPDQKNNDNDLYGDECDEDDDNDGINDGNDNCKFQHNPGQEDSDNDGVGDVCDNLVPVIITTPQNTGKVNKEYIYRMIARDNEKDELSYSVNDSRFEVDGFTYRFVPREEGIVNVIFMVTDSFGNMASQNASINIWNATVVKEKHNIEISSAVLEKEKVRAGDYIELYVKINNYGNKEEDNIRVVASMPDFGISETIDDIELKRHGSKLNYIEMKLPSDVKKGIYPLKVTAYNSKDKAVKYLSLEVL